MNSESLVCGNEVQTLRDAIKTIIVTCPPGRARARQLWAGLGGEERKSKYALKDLLKILSDEIDACRKIVDKLGVLQMKPLVEQKSSTTKGKKIDKKDGMNVNRGGVKKASQGLESTHSTVHQVAGRRLDDVKSEHGRIASQEEKQLKRKRDTLEPKDSKSSVDEPSRKRSAVDLFDADAKR